MPKAKPKDVTAKPGPTKMSAFRLRPETLALIDALAAHFSPGPEVGITKTAVIEMAVREMAERRLGKTKGKVVAR